MAQTTVVDSLAWFGKTSARQAQITNGTGDGFLDSPKEVRLLLIVKVLEN